MHTDSILKTVNSLLAGNKGLLAMDESLPTCNRRFEEAGIPQTVEMRRAYRELIVTTKNLGDVISGAILFDETIYQANNEGVLFIDILKNAGIVPGIKADQGTVDFTGTPGEKLTIGLDGLHTRLTKYYSLGVRFAKWRAMFGININKPTNGCIEANMKAMAEYASVCQELNMVPIVEPEILMDGNHDLKRCFDITKKTLQILFDSLKVKNVNLNAIILKPNMILPGRSSHRHPSINTIAEATVTCLLDTVPKTVPGIAFLSGGQSPEMATAHLNAMHVKYGSNLPWALTFSFSRAIQQPALELWKGKAENTLAAQDMLFHRANLDCAARRGEYLPEMEKDFNNKLSA